MALLRDGLNGLEIARKLGIDGGMVYADIRAIRAEWKAEAAASLSDWTAQQLASLAADEFATRQSMAAVIDPKEWGIYAKALDRIIDRRCRILGLYAPDRVVFEVHDLDALAMKILDICNQEIEDEAARYRVARRIDALAASLAPDDQPKQIEVRECTQPDSAQSGEASEL